MYSDTIKVDNKIITDNDLLDIFSKMNEVLRKNYQEYQREQEENKKYKYEYQKWNLRGFDGKISCTFNFYDATNVSVDNYDDLIAIYNSRLHEVKEMSVYYSFYYSTNVSGNYEYINHRISLYIYENKMNVNIKLSSKDKRMEEVYQLIKEKILKAPERYDRIIRKKTMITSKIGFSFGMIPSLIICTLLLFIPQVREVFISTYVLYPIIVMLLASFIGNTILNGTFNRLYGPLSPKQKYVRYDTTNHKSVYEDDIDDYVSNSEIIIGKNINNIRNRNEITLLEKKYSKYIPIELLVLLVISILIVLIGNAMGPVY